MGDLGGEGGCKGPFCLQGSAPGELRSMLWSWVRAHALGFPAHSSRLSQSNNEEISGFCFFALKAPFGQFQQQEDFSCHADGVSSGRAEAGQEGWMLSARGQVWEPGSHH